jgi:hypothetical protein
VDNELRAALAAIVLTIAGSAFAGFLIVSNLVAQADDNVSDSLAALHLDD